MAITRYDPNVIHLGGHITKVGDVPAAEAITPGHLIERAGGEYALHTAAAAGPLTLALDSPYANKTIDDAYAAGDLVPAGIFPSGSSGLAWLASGENVTDGDLLESAGSGMLAALASGVALARALEDKDTTTGDARIRVEAV